MEIEDLMQEIENLEVGSEKTADCGCDGAGSPPVSGDAAELMALETELDALESDADIEFGAFEENVDLDDELEFATALGDEENEGVPTLEEILALAKEYPGLKISFGF